MCKSFASNRDDAHSHITEEERAKVRDEARAAEDWVYDMSAKQSDTAPSADPVLTVSY